MTDARTSRALAFIRANQNADGGWGYWPRGMSFVEPTAFSLIALDPKDDQPRRKAGLGFLRSCQKGNGALGIDAAAAEGSWMSYAALLAFHALGASEEKRRLQDWILRFEDASGRFTKNEIAVTKARYRSDPTIPGWPWTPGTTAWVEPTALFILALVRCRVPLLDKRIQSGVDLLLDRRVPSGGWNYGNPFSLSYELEASTMSTALALAALAAAGLTERVAAVNAGLRYLEVCLRSDVSTASLCWALLALRGFPSGAGLAAGVESRLAGLQRSDGSFRGNLFETALASLVLDKSQILGPAAGADR